MNAKKVQPHLPGSARQPSFSKDNSAGLSGLLSAVLAQTATIQAANSGIDDRANNIMAAALVVLPLLGSQLIVESRHWSWLVIIPMISMILTIYLVLRITRGRDYAGAVVDLDEHGEYFTKPDAALLAQLIVDADNANSQNTKTLASKLLFFENVVRPVFLAGFTLGLVALFIIH